MANFCKTLSVVLLLGALAACATGTDKQTADGPKASQTSSGKTVCANERSIGSIVKKCTPPAAANK